MTLPRPALVAAVMGGAALAAPAALAAFADDQARNYTKMEERAEHEHMKPAYRRLLAAQEARSLQELVEIRQTDPERDSRGNLCGSHQDGCAGDVRLYDWGDAGFGLVQPVLYTARSGATISGHVWATSEGPRKRPGIVLTTGSVQAPEVLYLFAATTLAKRGYVVLTYDVQGQGRSDTRGEPPDENENFPAQQPQNFVDGTKDAISFFRSSPDHRYVPKPSRTSGTSHDDKQRRRVREGFNARHNPFHDLLDRSRLGIVGHSLGAFAVSKVASSNEEVDALVAWDNLRVKDGDARMPPRVPALGMSADYGLFREPLLTKPDPQGKNEASNEFSDEGVDTAQINVRGGTHYEWSYIPNPYFGATLRGMDVAAWYTAAWFDKYLKGKPSADRRLLTKRWLDDAREAEGDPTGDGNMYSRYFRSRFDFELSGGGQARCENLRGSCRDELVRDDGEPPNYSYLEEARTFEGGGKPYTPTASKLPAAKSDPLTDGVVERSRLNPTR